ncbi:MAG: hypothetical protein QGG14_06385 [Planctomycetota bacterium]|nr:hypothetical protein [Planctomycetota bacterium]
MIVNNQPRLVELPPVLPVLDDDGEVVEEGFTAYRLAPGENEVPEACWAKVVKNKAVKIWLAAGVIANTGEGTAKQLVNNLDAISQADALRHIANAENTALLNDWKRGTESLGLRTAIDERLAELVASQTGDAKTAVPNSPDGVEPVIEATLEGGGD